MNDFSFVPMGVGDAFSALYYSSCLVLEAEGERLLLDCPHPIRKVLREGGQSVGCPLDIPDISGILLTHLHADHSSGLEGFAYYNCYVRQPKQKTLLFAHPIVQKDLWEGQLAGSMGHIDETGTPQRTLSDFFDWHPLSFEHAVTWGPFSIECRQTIHSIPTTAFRIRVGEQCLGYSADTAFDPELIEWLSEADCIVHETNVGPHTPYEALLTLPEDIRQKMKLIHYPDTFDLYTSAIEPLVQGQLYRVKEKRDIG